MLAASLVAIFFIPVSYYVVEKLANRGKPAPEPPVAAPGTSRPRPPRRRRG
jgi:hypothetical protein